MGWRIAVCVSLWFSTGTRAASLACTADKPTKWVCGVQCWQNPIGDLTRAERLNTRVHSLTVCADHAYELQTLVSEGCAKIYASTLPKGWEARGQFFLNDPDSLLSCKAQDSACSAKGVFASIWECPAQCTGTRDSYFTRFSFCGMAQEFALKEGLIAYGASSAHPLCRKGYELREVPAEYGLRCRTTARECDCK